MLSQASADTKGNKLIFFPFLCAFILQEFIIFLIFVLCSRNSTIFLIYIWVFIEFYRGLYSSSPEPSALNSTPVFLNKWSQISCSRYTQFAACFEYLTSYLFNNHNA